MKAARILALQKQESDKLAEHAALLAEAAKTSRPLTAEERTKADAIEAEIDAIRATAKSERIQAEGAKVSVTFTGGDLAAKADPKRGFTSHTEMLLAVVGNSDKRNVAEVTDERLRPLAVKSGKEEGTGDGLAFMLPVGFGGGDIRATVGSDEHGEYDNRYGGFAVSKVQGPPRPMIGFDADPTEGRCEVIPMAAQTVEMDAVVDKSHATSVAGGLTVSRRAEATAGSASRQEMEKVTLRASMTFGLAYATEELLEDSPVSFVARIAGGFNQAFAAFKFNEKLRGGGGNARLGVLTALASSSLGPTISIAKETGQAADTLLYSNVVKARARCWGYSNAIWIANPDCYPQLVALQIPTGVGGQLIYQQSIVEDRPDMLLGRPIFYNEYAATIGDQGDLILGNWSQYMEGEYKALQSAESIHVRFVNHERTLKFFKRDTGAPSWKSALTPAKGSNTLSPFVVLDAR